MLLYLKGDQNEKLDEQIAVLVSLLIIMFYADSMCFLMKLKTYKYCVKKL